MNFPGWLLALYLAKGADLASTHLALQQINVRELNPMMESSSVRFATMIAVPLAVELGARKLERTGHKRMALWLRVGAVVGWGLATAHNLREGERVR